MLLEDWIVFKALAIRNIIENSFYSHFLVAGNEVEDLLGLKGIAADCLAWVYTPLYHPAHRLVVFIPCSCKKSLCQVHTELVEQSSYFLP